jgi:hypothetical protein
LLSATRTGLSLAPDPVEDRPSTYPQPGQGLVFQPLSDSPTPFKVSAGENE